MRFQSNLKPHVAQLVGTLLLFALLFSIYADPIVRTILALFLVSLIADFLMVFWIPEVVIEVAEIRIRVFRIFYYKYKIVECSGISQVIVGEKRIQILGKDFSFVLFINDIRKDQRREFIKMMEDLAKESS
jgi:hypothetical protein